MPGVQFGNFAVRERPISLRPAPLCCSNSRALSPAADVGVLELNQIDHRRPLSGTTMAAGVDIRQRTATSCVRVGCPQNFTVNYRGV